MDDASVRRIKRQWQSKPTVEGAGVQLHRAFGFREVPAVDPFLLLDDFHSENPAEYKRGFPWHPHRGIETITYVLDGDVEHGDSMGNRGLISGGDVQWMTAGSGIVHQEMPQGDGRGRLRGFQLWANLPARDKMMDPRYREVRQADIPAVKTADGATVKVVAGEVAGVRGPVQEIVIDPRYLDVSVPSAKTVALPIPAAHTAFAYVFEGEGLFDAANETAPAAGEGSFILYAPGGEVVRVRTESRAVRFLLISGRPIGEPVAWYGPIVMNTQEELRTAFAEYEQGTFVKTR
jgi:hypothetical protein